MTRSDAQQPRPRLGLALVIFVVVLSFLRLSDASARPGVVVLLALLALCPVLPLPLLRLLRARAVPGRPVR